ncbi:helix-turn-helix domain-containing protein [Variovorax sp. AB1(2024)]|uniref:helix-turn-helix domain-containing protein n=1 Tax=Variovorax sp. AB1(2024) TaxID=3132214 RepID=UPI00309C58DA
MTTLTTDGWIEEIPGLEIELLGNGNVRLTEKADFEGESWVDVHPIHVRFIAEKLGLLPTRTACDAQGLIDLRSEVEGLQRCMKWVQAQADSLHKMLSKANDRHDHELYPEVYSALELLNFCDFQIDAFEKTGIWAAERQSEPASSPSKGQAWAWQQPLEKSSTKFLLMAMAHLAGDSERCSASVQELADKTSQDRKTVLEGLKRLSDAGLIVDTGERSGATKSVAVYWLATDLNYEPPKTGQLNFEGEDK